MPGDYVLGFYKALEDSDLAVINTRRRARRGLCRRRLCAVQRPRRGLYHPLRRRTKVANTTAQAYAEKSPVVVIMRAPGVNERLRNPLLHHKVRDFDTQLKVFGEQPPVAAAVLDNRADCRRAGDRPRAPRRRPAAAASYIELPRDYGQRFHISGPEPARAVAGAGRRRPGRSRGRNCRAAPCRPAAGGAGRRRSSALSPAAATDAARRKTGLPVAATILSKSVVREDHPLYLGVYEGAMGRGEVTEYIEGSDCLIQLGVFLTDVNLGIFTARLMPAGRSAPPAKRAFGGYHNYDGVTLSHLLPAPGRRRSCPMLSRPHSPTAHAAGGFPVPDKPLTVRYLFERLNQFLDDATAVLADPGDAMFAGIDMTIYCASEFSSPAYYTSLGYAAPAAAIGVQRVRPDLRPLVLVGDGAFQMTGMELSTVACFGLSPIVVVLNNEGYGTECRCWTALQRHPSTGAIVIPARAGAGRGWR